MNNRGSLFKRISSGILRFAFHLVQPHSNIFDPSELRLAQLSAGLALASLFTNIGGFIAIYSLVGFAYQTYSLAINIIFASFAYFLSRSENFRIGATLLVISPIVNGIIVVASGSTTPGFSLMVTVPVAFIYASIFFSVKRLIFTTVLISGVTFFLPVFLKDTDVNSINTAGGQFMLWGVLVTIITASRNLIDLEKLNAFQEINTELKEFQLSLEDRVRQRTLELSLASELGQILSQVRELPILLEKSVQLIRDRFELYYVQIYLTDARNRNLVLQAGSGKIGRQLKNRGHRLVIDGSSLNGRAVFEKMSIIVENTHEDSSFRSNAMLPETCSEMCIPLIIGEMVIGVLDLQSNRPNELNKERLPAFTSLAGQLAIAIENTKLFQESLIANEELENRASQVTKEGWEEFLNAIDKDEKIGVVFEGEITKSVTNLIIEKAINNGFKNRVPIKLLDTEIGSIIISDNNDLELDNRQKHILKAVAEQVSRQLNNLRLVNQAQRYQHEAEDTIRRVTKEGWATYLSNTEGELGFLYNNNQVSQINPKTIISDTSGYFSRKLSVRNEDIGELIISGKDDFDDNTHELISNVVDQLSIHLENLRLSEQTQRALKETDILYTIISELNAVQNYEEILNVLSKHTILHNADQSLIMFTFDKPLSPNSIPEWVIPVSAKLDSTIQLAGRYPLSAFELTPNTIFTKSTIVIENVKKDPRLDRLTNTLFKDVFNAESSIIIPLLIGEQSLGFIMGNFGAIQNFNSHEIQRISTIASQIAISVQSMQLLEKTVTRAKREELLREVSNLINNATGTDAILRRTAEQVGKALKRPVYVYIDNNDVNQGNGVKSAEFDKS